MPRKPAFVLSRADLAREYRRLLKDSPDKLKEAFAQRDTEKAEVTVSEKEISTGAHVTTPTSTPAAAVSTASTATTVEATSESPQESAFEKFAADIQKVIHCDK